MQRGCVGQFFVFGTSAAEGEDGCDVRIGLTGGIGSGKSTVAGMLRHHGMAVIDADQVARDVVEPGQPALVRIAEHFGPGILAPDGRLDRAALAAIVFADPSERAVLEAITHPAIGAEIARRELAAVATDPDAIVVVDHPLLIESDRVDEFDALVVVLASEATRLARLQEHRGIDSDDARARMAAQASDDARRAAATWIIDNDGGLAAMEAAVADLVVEIRTRAGAA